VIMLILIGLAVMIGSLLVIVLQTLARQRGFERVARDAGWDRVDSAFLIFGVEGTWRGHAATIHYDRNSRWIVVRIEIPPPSRLVILRRRLLRVDIGGPPVVEVPMMDDYKVRADSADFARMLLADEELRRAMDDASRLREIRLTSRIEVNAVLTYRWTESEVVVRQAWAIAAAVAEKLRA
jgi:hypothetical protein